MTPTQVFSCEICETFKNTFFYRAPPVAASAIWTGWKDVLKIFNNGSIWKKTCFVIHLRKENEYLRSFFWSVFSHIWSDTDNQSKYGKARTRKNSVFEHFSRSINYTHLFILIYTYLSILMFSLYFYTNLIKLIKYGKYRNYDEIF